MIIVQFSKHVHSWHVIIIDVLHHESFGDVAEEVSSIIGGGGLNLLINNAGISPRSTRINYVSADQMNETFAVNTISPLLLTKAFLPLLKEAANNEAEEAEEFCINNSVVVNMSSILGSISENTGDHSGGLYPYRCSKVWKQLNILKSLMTVKNLKPIIPSSHITKPLLKTQESSVKSLNINEDFNILKNCSKTWKNVTVFP